MIIVKRRFMNERQFKRVEWRLLNVAQTVPLIWDRHILEPPFETHIRVQRFHLLVLAHSLLESVHRILFLLLKFHHVTFNLLYLLIKIPNFPASFVLDNWPVHLKHHVIRHSLPCPFVHLPDFVRFLRGILHFKLTSNYHLLSEEELFLDLAFFSLNCILKGGHFARAFGKPFYLIVFS